MTAYPAVIALGRPTYLMIFAIAAMLCVLAAIRARHIADRETRRGLIAFVLMCGTWAASHIGYLAAPMTELRYGFFLLGLLLGIAAVGAWLYFCAAYTGRVIHQDPRIRWGAVAVFAVIVAVKVTNPVHGWYFTAETVTVPFEYLKIDHSPLHWVVMGLAYALAFIGFFMLFELFHQVRHDTKPLVGLVLLTGVPVVLDVFGPTYLDLLPLTYAPVGVAIFAVGVTYVYMERFERIRLAGTRDEPIVVLDQAGQIRDYNPSALDLFPHLEESIGEEFAACLPRVAEAAERDDNFDIWTGSRVRYFRIGSNPFAAGRTQLGEIVTFTDVTEDEHHRQELQRQVRRLETFASMVSHDLRNPLTVAMGHLELLGDTEEDEHVEAATTALERMDELIENMLVLARTGQPIDEFETVELRDIANQCWSVVSTGGRAELQVHGTMSFRADPGRLQQLFENLLRNAIDHGDPPVNISVGPLDDRIGFFVEDDGPGIPENEREQVFEYGYSTAEAGTGFGLAIVKEIAEAHGWQVAVVEGTEGGARFEVTGLDAIGDES